MKLSWLLRGTTWRRFHVHRCLECRRTFTDTEPGCWTGNRSDEYPELCHCDPRQLRRGLGHTGCKAWGPYCPACAPKVEARLIENRQVYRGW